MQRNINNILAIIFFVGAMFYFLIKYSPVNDDPPQPSISSVQNLEYRAPINDDAFSVYTQEGFPNTYARWGGEAGFARIELLAQKAAAIVARDRRCDRIELVELSNFESVPPDKLVVFVNCTNRKQFYFSENDVQ